MVENHHNIVCSKWIWAVPNQQQQTNQLVTQVPATAAMAEHEEEVRLPAEVPIDPAEQGAPSWCVPCEFLS